MAWRSPPSLPPNPRGFFTCLSVSPASSRGLTAAARDRPNDWLAASLAGSLPARGVVAINTSGDSRHDGVREERERFPD